jgi:hypothetical protein
VPRQDDDLPAYIDEIHQDIAEFAARHLDEDERDDFVDQLLERKGYQRQSIWAPPEPDGAGDGGGKRPLVKPAAKGQGQGQGRQGGGRGSYFGGKR